MYTLIGLAVLPGIILLTKVYKMDAIEKEPPNLIFKLVVLGAIAVIPAAIAEGFFIGLLDNSSITAGSISYYLVENFLIVAMAEELVKFFALRIASWNHPAFNYSFDGIVYAVSAALGFAIIENVMYVLQGGLYVALMRAVLSVPGHAVFGFFMGVFYAAAKKASVRGHSGAQAGSSVLAIVVPVLLHGFYDFALSVKTEWATIAFYIFVIILYIFAWKLLKKMSAADEML